MADKKVRNVVIDWSDIKDRYIRGVEKGEKWRSQPSMNNKFVRWHANPYGKDGDEDYDYLRGRYDDKKWEGGTPADTLKWLREGFHAPEFAHSAERVPTTPKFRNVWNEEEGDPDPGRLIGGYDSFFQGPQKRLSKPGLRVQIEFAFAWTVSSKTIQEYGAWCAGFLGSLESSGFDIVVDMWIPLDGLFQEDGYYDNHRTNVLVRVKRPNEISDFTEWSALFGPTGYRQLGFTAKAVAAEKCGKTISSSFGMTIGGKTWGLKYDPDGALVTITCNQRASGGERFPNDTLNKLAREAGLI
jgi:hypothetical protein